MKQLEAELNDIIENKRIRSVFQPIVSLRDGSILGFEALSRIVGESEINNIEVLFEQAILHGRIWELEQLCRGKSLDTLFEEQRGYRKKLFLNVNPLVINDPKFKQGFTREHLNYYGFTPEQITFEITENASAEDQESFRGVIAHYKNQHYEIALDDVGSCYSGLNLICDIHPHYLKIDRQLIYGIHKDGTKRAMLKSLTELADSLGMNVVAEGIEEPEELAELIQLGVHYGQGFLLGRPGRIIEHIGENVEEYIRKCNKQKNRLFSHDVQKYYISNIAAKGITVQEDMLVEQAVELFGEDSALNGVTVLNGEKIVGIMTRDKMSHALSGRYGFSLHQKKPISCIMEKKFLAVDEKSAIRQVSVAAMERSAGCLYDFLVVTSGGKYSGIVTVKELLQKTLEIAVATAKVQSPLTELPGNLIIDEEIERTLNHDEKYTIAYFDLDNFKAFNDIYGFEKGDLAIKELARVLKLNTSQGDFIGHIGGDDFVTIFRRHNCDEVCTRIIHDYTEGIRRYYSPQDRERGYIEAVGRNGVKERFPLLSVTAALADNRERNYKSVEEITEILALRKKNAKNEKRRLA